MLTSRLHAKSFYITTSVWKYTKKSWQQIMIRHLKNDTKHEIKKCNMSAKLQMKACVFYINIWFLVCRCKETECWQAACMQNLFISPLQCESTPTNWSNKWDCLKIMMNIRYKSKLHSKLLESEYVLY